MATTPCGDCGALVPAGAVTCPGCGTPTTAPVAPPPPPPPGPPPQAAPPPPPPPQGFPPVNPGFAPPGATQPGYAPPGAPAPGQPAAVPPVFQQPAHQPAPAGAAPAEGRNRTAGLLAVIGFGVVLLGTFLPIVQLDFGETAGVLVDDSLNG